MLFDVSASFMVCSHWCIDGALIEGSQNKLLSALNDHLETAVDPLTAEPNAAV